MLWFSSPLTPPEWTPDNPMCLAPHFVIVGCSYDYQMSYCSDKLSVFCYKANIYLLNGGYMRDCTSYHIIINNTVCYV